MEKMAIVELKDLEEFKKLAGNFDKTRYILYITASNELILRPTVTTPRVDTIYIRKISDSDVKELEQIWGNIVRISRFYFDETDKRISLG